MCGRSGIGHFASLLMLMLMLMLSCCDFSHISHISLVLSAEHADSLLMAAFQSQAAVLDVFNIQTARLLCVFGRGVALRRIFAALRARSHSRSIGANRRSEHQWLLSDVALKQRRRFETRERVRVEQIVQTALHSNTTQSHNAMLMPTHSKANKNHKGRNRTERVYLHGLKRFDGVQQAVAHSGVQVDLPRLQLHVLAIKRGDRLLQPMVHALYWREMIV